MQQAALAHEVNEDPIRHHRFDLGLVDIAHGGGEGDAADAVQGRVDGIAVATGDVDDTLLTHFRDVDNGAGFSLDFLDDFATRADDSADIAFINDEFHNARSVWLEVFARLGNGFRHFP